MAVVGYSRVSTSGQDHRLQLDALEAAGCDYVVSEVGSGADEDARPSYNASYLIFLTRIPSLSGVWTVWRGVSKN